MVRDGNLEYPGWYFGVLANVNITIVSAILHGVDYHSNNLNQKTNTDPSCPQVEHDPALAGPPAPGGNYGPWEWLDYNDDGSDTNDPPTEPTRRTTTSQCATRRPAVR